IIQYIVNIMVFFMLTLLCKVSYTCVSFFFLTDTPTTEIYTLSLHDALPIFELWTRRLEEISTQFPDVVDVLRDGLGPREAILERSEEHTSELQSRGHLVCRLLLEKKNLHIITIAVDHIRLQPHPARAVHLRV